MRNKVSSALQKTYDECYLICSTAVYFEGQGNEAEALRSWRSALDQIYYHNAYKVPPGYVPRSETEKSLKDSLKDMEIRCKERADLLQALKQSREEESKDDTSNTSTDDSSRRRKVSKSKAPILDKTAHDKGFIGNGTVPAMDYADLNRLQPPSLPQRPAYGPKSSSEYAVVGKKKSKSPARTSMDARQDASSSSSSSKTAQLKQKSSRSPSPEKRTMLHTLRNPDKSGKKSSPRSPRPPKHREDSVTNKAASLAWQSGSSSTRDRLGKSVDAGSSNSVATLDGGRQENSTDFLSPRPSSANVRYDSRTRTLVPDDRSLRPSITGQNSNDSSRDSAYAAGRLTRHRPQSHDKPRLNPFEDITTTNPVSQSSSMDTDGKASHTSNDHQTIYKRTPPPPPPPHTKPKFEPVAYPTYLQEYPETTAKRLNAENALSSHSDGIADGQSRPPAFTRVQRRPVSANTSSPRNRPSDNSKARREIRRQDNDDDSSPDHGFVASKNTAQAQKGTKQPESHVLADPITPTTEDSDNDAKVLSDWDLKVATLMKNLPKGVDEGAAKQIFNEIVVQGDEVHWEDVAGLDIAKNALKEAVVYPFLRPDLFMGLREPARGMLLFGPPGTGKTMLARAVATESRSTFFSISASSLTSKFLGESEKLVRALFMLAKALAPSIIFVDEIDSLLSTRASSGEHEATRRIKTEFLIQWSDLQRAAAGREQSEKDKERGDASRVLVLAATNLPWAIDEAARRRFVRRQYIPLPEDETRGVQLRTLLSHQKHSLSEQDIQYLVTLTDGFSGSDITALAKDAAMGPLRSLGEKLLEMSMDDIRPMQIVDFEASLVNIRPSVSKQGLKEFEDWAKEFGERGG